MAIERASDTPSEMNGTPAPPTAVLDPSILTAAKGGGILFAATLVGEVLRLPLGIILARILGPDQLGLYHLAVSAVGVASGLTLLGLGAALVRYVSLFSSRGDTAGLWGALQVGIGLPTVLSVVAGLGLLILSEPIAYQLLQEPRLVPLLRIVSVILPFWTLMLALGPATRGFKRMECVSINRIGQPLVRLALIILLTVTLGLSAMSALAAFGLAVFASSIFLLGCLNRLFPLRRSLRAARYEVRELLGFSLPVYASSLLDTLGPGLNTFLLGALGNTAAVGVYVPAAQVTRMGGLFRSSVATASQPIVAEIEDRGAREQLKTFYQTTSKWVFTVSLPLFLIIILFPVPIMSVFGEGYAEGEAALILLGWAGLVTAGTGLSATMIDMTGHTRLKLVNSLSTYAIILGLDALLIPEWGVVGAAMASLAAAVAVSILQLLEVFVLFRILPFNASFLKPVAAGLVAVVASEGTARLAPVDASLGSVVLATAVLLSVYSGAVLLLGLSREDRQVAQHLARRLVSILLKNSSSTRGDHRQ